MRISSCFRAVPSVCVVLAASLPAGVAGQAPEARLAGAVVDDASSAPLADVEVRLEAPCRATTGEVTASDATGRFFWERVAGRECTLLFRRIGYASVRVSVDVPVAPGEALEVRMRPSALEMAGMLVTAAGRVAGVEESFRPADVIEGEALRRRLGGNVAATLAGEPGVVQRYNGPVAAQPIIRGLGGDRVLMLEDGQRTGDIATTAADHAVTIDPLSAERIEVLRGPAGLVHGANTLGGVINVVRNDVPRSLPDAPRGEFAAQAESGNAGVVGMGTAEASWGPVAMRAAYSQRHASDTRTPTGSLPQTDLDGYDAGAGVSWVGSRGFLGVAARDYTSYYGVPSSFGGAVIPGAHEGGVYIDLRRSTLQLAGETREPGGAFTAVRLDANYVRFEQDELEEGGLVGTRFGQLQSGAKVVARYEREGGLAASGALGASVQWRDLRATGSFTGTRPATELSLGVFALEEYEIAPFRLQVGARFDAVDLTPRDTTSSRYLPEPRARRFQALSGSVALLWPVAEGWVLGASVARAFRTPAIEELYSNGPHLANYAYEVGNPTLVREVGTGVDAFVRVARPEVRAEVSLFVNSIEDFVQHVPLLDSNTGRPQLDYRLRRYFVYRAEQTDALLSGGEVSVEWEALPRYVLEASGSWVRGTDRTTSEALPAMPPAQGRVAVRHDAVRWFAGVGLHGALAQRRVPEAPPEAECPENGCPPLPGEFLDTDGFALLEASVGARLQVGGRFHSLTLSVDNLLDSVWYDHLSRIKTVAPQPGRSIRLLYRVEL